ncbi:MAG: lipid-A-disaccharide synthase, partial [Muribaculaceae bacterium]|nr:lipid-A-disaccharide synthase [Muribaculaceae bacterium]
ATLEAALIGTPQVVCYRSNGSRLTYSLMKNILHVRFVSLPNLIVDRQIIPEMLLHECTPIAILEKLLEILPGKPERERQLQGYHCMRQILGTANAAENAAKLITSDFNI